MKTVIVLLLLVGFSSASCPERKLKEIRNAHTKSLFKGTWKTVYLIPSDLDRRLICKVDTYNTTNDGEVLTYSYALNASCGGATWERRGSLYFPTPGHFNVVTEQGVGGSYWILGTDYSNYFVLYSCLQQKYGDVGLCWIQSRSSFLKAELHHRVSSVLKRNGFKWDDFVPMAQKHCEEL